MDIDREFFSIVEQLGPMGDIKLRSFGSHPSRVKGFNTTCGCGTDDANGCCKSSGDEAVPQ